MKILAASVFFVSFCVSAAHADDPDFLVLGGGWYDWNDNEGAADLRLEYRHDYKLLGFAKPWFGIEATSETAIYGLGGILVDLYFGRRWVFTPSFGAGAYSDGDGKNLGHTVEFRSQLEFGYRFDNRSRISLAVSHISNASLDDNNPGTEIATVYYHIPFSAVFE
ncbi:MAG: deacylase [Alphaproteobacteria bacterium]|nr:deacylase [Alphaproteobacteria bacterium]HCP00624.1 acyloxyacyl hydrolase [Rhodospirillaceae bacterium]